MSVSGPFIPDTVLTLSQWNNTLIAAINNGVQPCGGSGVQAAVPPHVVTLADIQAIINALKVCPNFTAPTINNPQVITADLLNTLYNGASGCQCGNCLYLWNVTVTLGYYTSVSGVLYYTTTTIGGGPMPEGQIYTAANTAETQFSASHPLTPSPGPCGALALVTFSSIHTSHGPGFNEAKCTQCGCGCNPGQYGLYLYANYGTLYVGCECGSFAQIQAAASAWENTGVGRSATYFQC
jgi:hypothetical protein